MNGSLKLRGEGLVKRYGGREVVSKIDLDVGAGEVVGAAQGADDVITALDDGRGDLAHLVDVSEQLIRLQPDAVDEVVAFEAGQRERFAIAREVIDHRFVRP